MAKLESTPPRSGWGRKPRALFIYLKNRPTYILFLKIIWEIQAIIFLENVFTALVSYRIKFTWILFFENTLKIKNFF